MEVQGKVGVASIIVMEVEVGIVIGVVEDRVGLGVEGVVMVVAMEEMGIITGVVEVRVGLGQVEVDLMIAMEVEVVEELEAIEKVTIHSITRLPSCYINTHCHVPLIELYHPPSNIRY